MAARCRPSPPPTRAWSTAIAPASFRSGSLDHGHQRQPVGSYTITATGGSASNYTITDVNGTLTVNKAALTITANNKAMAYGGTVPTLDATSRAWSTAIRSSVVSGLVLSTTASSASPAGTYTITASGGTANNYTITDVNGTLTVGKVVLTITANNQSMTYGGTVPTLTATYTGLVNGDTSSIVTGLKPLTTATSASPAGTYTITASGGSPAITTPWSRSTAP